VTAGPGRGRGCGIQGAEAAERGPGGGAVRTGASRARPYVEREGHLPTSQGRVQRFRTVVKPARRGDGGMVHPRPGRAAASEARIRSFAGDPRRAGLRGPGTARVGPPSPALSYPRAARRGPGGGRAFERAGGSLDSAGGRRSPVSGSSCSGAGTSGDPDWGEAQRQFRRFMPGQHSGNPGRSISVPASASGSWGLLPPARRERGEKLTKEDFTRASGVLLLGWPPLCWLLFGSPPSVDPVRHTLQIRGREIPVQAVPFKRGQPYVAGQNLARSLRAD